MSLKHRKPAVMHAVGDQTPAVRHHIATMGGMLGSRGMHSGVRRRKRRSASSAAPRKRRSKRHTARAAMVKGSAAAKAWGRKMRRHRKK